MLSGVSIFSLMSACVAVYSRMMDMISAAHRYMDVALACVSASKRSRMKDFTSFASRRRSSMENVCRIFESKSGHGLLMRLSVVYSAVFLE